MPLFTYPPVACIINSIMIPPTPPSKRPLLLLLGITGDFAFAAGCLLLSLRRHNPELRPDIRLYTDGNLLPADEAILLGLGVTPVLFSPPPGEFREYAIRQFSRLSLARFEGFRLLSQYRTVLWLDVDIAIQGDITDLTTLGPFALALEDPCFSESGVGMKAKVNVHGPVPNLDVDAPNLNSGVLVLQDSLPDPESLYRRCLDWMREHAPSLKYIDQAALNMLARELQKTHPELVRIIPHDRFNAHPRNPAAQHAAIVHAFGAYKIWDDGLTRCAFPEWERDYRRWLDLGGSPWQGSVNHAEYLDGGAFFMLKRLFDLINSAEECLKRQVKQLEQQQAELEREHSLRTRLETALKKLNS